MLVKDFKSIEDAIFRWSTGCRALVIAESVPRSQILGFGCGTKTITPTLLLGNSAFTIVPSLLLEGKSELVPTWNLGPWRNRMVAVAAQEISKIVGAWYGK